MWITKSLLVSHCMHSYVHAAYSLPWHHAPIITWIHISKPLVSKPLYSIWWGWCGVTALCSSKIGASGGGGEGLWLHCSERLLSLPRHSAPCATMNAFMLWISCCRISISFVFFPSPETYYPHHVFAFNISSHKWIARKTLAQQQVVFAKILVCKSHFILLVFLS